MPDERLNVHLPHQRETLSIAREQELGGTMAGADVALCMRRRSLIGVLVGATVLSPAAARSQASAEAPKLGFVYPGPKEAVASRVDALVGGLRTSGYPVPQLELVVRVGEGDPSR